MGLKAVRVYSKYMEENDLDFKRLPEIDEINLAKIIEKKVESGEYLRNNLITESEAEALIVYNLGEQIYYQSRE